MRLVKLDDDISVNPEYVVSCTTGLEYIKVYVTMANDSHRGYAILPRHGESVHQCKARIERELQDGD